MPLYPAHVPLFYGAIVEALNPNTKPVIVLFVAIYSHI
jgi:hypothetical protein